MESFFILYMNLTITTANAESPDPFSSIQGSWNTGNLSADKSGLYYTDYRNLDPAQYPDHGLYFSIAWIFADRSPSSFLNNNDLDLAKSLLEALALDIETRKVGVLQCVCITTKELIYSFYLQEAYVDQITSAMRELDQRDEFRFEWETALDDTWEMYHRMRKHGYLSFDDLEALQESETAESRSSNTSKISRFFRALRK